MDAGCCGFTVAGLVGCVYCFRLGFRCGLFDLLLGLYSWLRVCVDCCCLVFGCAAVCFCGFGEGFGCLCFIRLVWVVY